ncbi:MAG: hypothetical protein H6739_15000 [Alphaproteobacteria bacterium]|nr:hypothetical protein [Alphaproteobacteria bacterium]
MRRAILWSTPTLLLCGCPPKDEIPVDSGLDAEFEVEQAPVAPWDPIRLCEDVVRLNGDRVSHTCAAEPQVLDADGAAVAVEPLRWRDEVYAWRHQPAFEVGDYTIEGSADFPDRVSFPFTVEPYGRNPSFDPAFIEGQRYRLDAEPWGAAGIESLLWQFAGVLHLEILEVGDGEARFRITTTIDDNTCEVLVATGTLSDTGELNWAVDEIEAETDPGPTEMRNLGLRLGFSGDGTRAAGVSVSGEIDLQYVQDAYDAAVLADWEADGAEGDPPEPGGLCGLVAGFGIECYECADADSACVSTFTHGGTLVQVSNPEPGAELPACGLDLDEAVEPFACDIDIDIDFGGIDCSSGCASSSGHGAPEALLALFGVLFARRRRSMVGCSGGAEAMECRPRWLTTSHISVEWRGDVKCWFTRRQLGGSRSAIQADRERGVGPSSARECLGGAGDDGLDVVPWPVKKRSKT